MCKGSSSATEVYQQGKFTYKNSSPAKVVSMRVGPTYLACLISHVLPILLNASQVICTLFIILNGFVHRYVMHTVKEDLTSAQENLPPETTSELSAVPNIHKA